MREHNQSHQFETLAFLIIILILLVYSETDFKHIHEAFQNLQLAFKAW